MATPKVYILIRTSLDFSCTCWKRKRYKYFRECLNSVLMQSYDNISILLLQDTKEVEIKKVITAELPKLCSDIVSNWSKVKSDSSVRDLHFYKANCGGPALALYYLRKQLEELPIQSDDIVLVLDDDDFFKREDAVADIVRKMAGEENLENRKTADVCILSFDIVGDSSLDISNGGGHIHNSLVKELDGEYKKLDDFDYNDKELSNKWLSFADSLGWSKAYKYHVVQMYMRSISEYFVSEEKVIQFYRKNNAYEDFPDIINLCWANTIITGCSDPTHAYRKTKSSITASPRLRDFSKKRTAYLSLLLGLAKRADISNAGKAVIARYVVVKLVLIENIMSKFRNDGTKHNIFRNFTKRAYFFNHLIERLTADDNIVAFAEILKSMPLYDKAIKSRIDPVKTIEEAAIAEVKLGNVDVQQCIREKVLAGDKPINLYRRRMIDTIVLCGIIISLCVVFVVISIKTKFCETNAVITVAGAIVSALLTYAGKYVVDYHSKSNQDKLARRIYKNELKDMIRHLYANLNVLLQIREELTDNKEKEIRPAKIHFINLKIPQNSILLSEEPIKDIMINELDTIARIKVNIRNINNSADYLCGLTDNSVDINVLENALSWEITRYVGYIINLMYVLDDPSFRFPQDMDQLDRFVNINGILETLASQIKDGDLGNNPTEAQKKSSLEKRYDIIEKEYQEYKEDRLNKRKVLFV